MCLSNLAIFMFNSNIQFCLCFFFVQSGSCLFYNTHFCLHVYCWAVFFLSAFLCTRQSFVHTKSSTGPHTHTLELYDRAMSKQSNENILIDMDDCEFLAVHQLASVILGGGKCPLAGRCCCHMAARFYFHSTVICLHFKIRREKNYIVAQNIKSCVNNTTTPTIPIDAAANAQPKCLKCRGTLELIKNSNMLSKFNQNDRRKKMGEGMRWWRRCCQFSWIDFFRKCITDSVCWPNVSGFDTTLLVVCACVRS